MPVKTCLLLLGIIDLVGCAQLPAQTPQPPEIIKPELHQTLASVATDTAFVNASATGHPWWTTFNDKALDTLVEMSIRGNPTLATTQARIEQARRVSRLVELDSGLRYESDASIVRQHLSDNGLFPPPLGGSTFNEGDVSIGVAYALDWWGKNRALLASAIGESRAAEAEHSAAELTLAGEVVDAFFNWQDIVARLNLTRQIVEKRRLALQLTRSRLKRGIDSAMVSSQMEVQLNQEVDNLKDLETQSGILRDRLAALTGNGPDWGATLVEPAQSSSGPFPLPSKLPLDVLAYRPDVAALKWRVEAAAKQIDVAKADFYPNVDLRSALGLQSLDLSNWLTDKSWYGSVGPAIHIPLFNGSTLRTNLGIKETEYNAAVARYNQALLLAANQVADSLTRISSLDARERLQHETTVSSERSQHLQTERFENGLSDRLPVLDEEIAALVQHAREAKLQGDHKRAMAALFVALGGGYDSSQEKIPNVGNTQK